MKQQIRFVVTWGCSLSLLMAMSSYRATGQPKPDGAYDGHWWLSIASSERTGFLNGYFDCYTYEYKGPDRFSSAADTYRNSITQFYEKGQSFELNGSVADLLHRFRDPQGRIVIDKYAEHNTGPHGGNDGLYWRQISADAGPEMEQRGFVEGYLACHTGLDHNKSGTFSKSVEEYVKVITQWYGFNRATDDINANHEPTAIADVLFKFRDQTQPAKSGDK